MLFNSLALSAAVLLNCRAAVAQRASTPCQSVSSMSAAFTSLYPRETIALVPAQAAEDCLRSVPINKKENVALMEEMQLYINWQSNLAYMINPPPGYTEDRVDIKDSMTRINNDLKADKYKDEYTFMRDISKALAQSYDFHFAFVPDIENVFRFRRGNIGRGLLDEFAVVSVSSDGKALPELYNYYDVMVAAKEKWNPSPITEINNRSAEDFLQKWSDVFMYHEDHARYNRLFPNQAQISMGSRVNQFGRSTIPDGDYTFVKHKNGTTRQYINNAILPLKAFEGVRDGASFYRGFLNKGPPSANSKRGAELTEHIVRRMGGEEASKVKRQSAKPTATGFPTPQLLHSEGVIGGYYLSGSGYNDVAVLSVPSFSPDTDNGPYEFQDLTGQFLQDAVKAGKTKLVIDLRGNGGGRVFLGYDLFKQLFPSEDPYGASQFRANQAFNKAGEWMSTELGKITYEQAIKDFEKNGYNSKLAPAYQSIFNYRVPITVDGKNFTSWKDYFGPHKFNGDDFTSISRKDLNNFFSDDLSLDVTGYRTRATKLNKKQPFESKNIVLLQDGGCGSTCAVFSEFMKTQGQVQQIVVGGKPETGPMQGVSGSKGSQVYTWTQVYRETAVAYEYLSQSRQEQLNNTELGQLYYAQRPLMRSAYQNSRDSSSVINLRDNIRMGDKTATPLEFVYEAADCRLFYTGEMIRDVEVVWRKTVDAHWGDAGKVCVEGSTGHKSSISGGFTVGALQQNQKNAAPRSAGRNSLWVAGSLVAAAMLL